jgi:hypothetical protein
MKGSSAFKLVVIALRMTANGGLPTEKPTTQVE